MSSVAEDPIVDDDFDFASLLPASFQVSENDNPVNIEAAATGMSNTQPQPDVLNLYIKSSTAKVVDKSIAFKLKQSGVTNTSGVCVAETERLAATNAPVIHVAEDWTIGGFGVWCAEDETLQACHVDSSLYMSRKRADLAALADAVVRTVALPQHVVIHVTAKHAELSKMKALASCSWKAFCDTDNVDLLQQIQLASLIRETMELPAARIKEWSVQDVEHDPNHGMHHAHALARKAVLEGKQAVQNAILQHLHSVLSTAAPSSSHQFSSAFMEENGARDDAESALDENDDSHDCIELNELIGKPVVRMSLPAAVAFKPPKTGSDAPNNTAAKQQSEIVIRHKPSAQRLFPITVVKPRARKQRNKKNAPPANK